MLCNGGVRGWAVWLYIRSSGSLGKLRVNLEAFFPSLWGIVGATVTGGADYGPHFRRASVRGAEVVCRKPPRAPRATESHRKPPKATYFSA